MTGTNLGDRQVSEQSHSNTRGRSGSVSVGLLAHTASFEPCACLWQVWALISPLLPSSRGFSFALGHGVCFFVGILLLTVVQQRVAILEFSQKMSTHPSPLPSKTGKDRTLKEEPPRSAGAHMLLEISGEITPERMKGWSQRKTTPSCGCDW